MLFEMLRFRHAQPPGRIRNCFPGSDGLWPADYRRQPWGHARIRARRRNRLLVEYDHVNVLADRLIRLLQDEELCRRTGDAGRRAVEANFSFEQFRERLTRILD